MPSPWAARLSWPKAEERRDSSVEAQAAQAHVVRLSQGQQDARFDGIDTMLEGRHRLWGVVDGADVRA